MRIIYLLFSFTFLFSIVNAQMPNLEWDRVFQSDQHMAFFLFETDALGNTYFGGLIDDTTVFYSDQVGWNVLMNQDPNTSSSTGWSQYFGKFDANGEIIFGGFNGFPGRLHPLNDGTAFTTGSHSHGGGGFSPIVTSLPGFSSTQITVDTMEKYSYIQKLDWNGNIDFEYIFYVPGAYISTKSSCTDQDRNLFVVIETTVSFDVDFDQSQSHIIVPGQHMIKYDENGEYIDSWELPVNFRNRKLFIDNYNQMYLVGEIYSDLIVDLDLSNQVVNVSNPHYTAWYCHEVHTVLAKYDENMAYQWHVKYSSKDDFGRNSIDVDKVGDVYFGDSFDDSCFLYQGEVLIDTLVEDTSALGYYSSNIMMTKISSSGQVLFYEQLGGPSCDFLIDLDVDNFNNVYLMGGYCQDSLDINFTASGPYMLYTEHGSSFIAKYDVNMNPQWGENYSSPAEEVSPVGIETDDVGYIYTCFNAFSDTIDYNPGSTTNNQVFPVNRLGVMLKYGSPYASIKDHEYSELITLYPNPTNGQFNLQFETQKDEVQIDIFSIQGNLIHSENHYHVSQISSYFEGKTGVYLVKLRFDGGEQVLKLVKE